MTLLTDSDQKSSRVWPCGLVEQSDQGELFNSFLFYNPIPFGPFKNFFFFFYYLIARI